MIDSSLGTWEPRFDCRNRLFSGTVASCILSQSCLNCAELECNISICISQGVDVKVVILCIVAYRRVQYCKGEIKLEPYSGDCFSLSERKAANTSATPHLHS